MRVQHIKIAKWRHFENIELDVPDTAPVVCLVGGNGTGKSQLLELIAASAQHVGLSQGFESGRGNPFSESGELEVGFFIASGAVPTLDQSPAEAGSPLASWDRTLLVRYTQQTGVRVTAGGIADEGQAQSVAQQVANLIRVSQSIHYLTLDADRAYPRIQVPTHELGTALRRTGRIRTKRSHSSSQRACMKSGSGTSWVRRTARTTRS